MNVGGICDLCHRPAEKVYTCFKCGKRVCKRCYTHDGLCLNCAGHKPKAGPASEIIVPECAKPTSVDVTQIKK
ncbi:hypothetical protein K8R43_02535 [archaeon]|nr:hypothetical protein [archaeon]